MSCHVMGGGQRLTTLLYSTCAVLYYRCSLAISLICSAEARSPPPSLLAGFIDPYSSGDGWMVFRVYVYVYADKHIGR